MRNEVGGDVTGMVVQARDIGSIAMPAPAPMALAGLPPDEGFSGRAAELAVLADALGPAGVPVVSVAGPPGVGKSALAVRAARLAADSFPGGVLFVNLHGYDSARRIDGHAALGSLLRALGVRGEHIPAHQDERETLFRSELARRERVLVVADNASDTDQVTPLRPGTPHRLLVTSRHTLPIPRARRIEVDVLLPADSITVLDDALLATHGTTVDPDVAAELAELCGHLPLALCITAELLADQPDSAAELVGILRDARSRLGELAYGDSAAVRAAFDASYQRLPADQARLFRLLSVHPGPHFSRETAAALIGEPIDITRHLLDGLRRAHLIEPGYRFHDLLLLYAREQCQPDERAPAIERLLDFYRTVEITDLERVNFMAVTALAANTGHDLHVLDFAEKSFSYFSRHRYWAESVVVNGCAVAAALQLGDQKRANHFTARIGIADRHLHRCDQALNCLAGALQFMREVGDLRAAGHILNSIGATYRQLGEPDKAEECLGEALSLFLETGDRDGEAISLNSLGGICKAQHRFDESLDLYQRALVARREAGDRAGEGLTLNGLGYLHRDLGRYDEALAYYAESLAVRRAVADDIGEAITLRGIGSTYVCLRQIDKALEYYRLALTGFEQANSLRDVEDVRGLIEGLSQGPDQVSAIWTSG